MKNVTEPVILCNKTYVKKRASREKLKFLKERIHEGYMQQWVVDNMPVTWCYSILESSKPFCTTRFPVGCYVTEGGQRHDACFLSVSAPLSLLSLLLSPLSPLSPSLYLLSLSLVVHMCCSPYCTLSAPGQVENSRLNLPLQQCPTHPLLPQRH